jgi:ABC-type Fe3+-hydroxamate transport system substrate-binding protein
MQDALGRHFDFPRPPRRVVSLVPSLTETLFAIGAGECLAAVTNFCIFPPNDLPRIGGTKNPRVEEIRAREPDLVYVNVEENLARHAQAIEQFAPVFATHPKSVDDVIALIDALGAIHHQPAGAATVAGEIGKEVLLPPVVQFRFACPIWKEPWMWCGGDTYVSDLVTRAGGTNVLLGELRYPARSLVDVLARRPDVLFLPDEPFVFQEEDATELRAAGAARVIGPFPGHLFTWHGSRTLLGLRFLRQTVGTVREAG